MKKLLLFLLFLSTSIQLFAQNEASFWYFGNNAGLQFNAQAGTVTAITDGQINTLEGCTSISDSDGNLLFYSDGQTVWNQDHQKMANGDYFAGTGLYGDPSSTSSGLIVPKPEDPDKYYIFTVDEPHQDNANAYPNQFTGTYAEGGSVPYQDDGFNNGFNYTLIDMTLNGGLGDVDINQKNIHLVTYDTSIPIENQYKCSEKITAVRAEDCSSFWVITHFGNKFYAFKIDENGVESTPVISEIAPYVPIEGYRRNSLGYIKTSPDASKLIAANYGEATITGENASGNIFLYDFNNETGIISNPLEIYSAENGNSPYGVEFSAESKKVYATVSEGASGSGTSYVLQWDLESSDIPNSQQTVHTSNSISSGALQLGIDKRIYRAQLSYNGHPTISKYLGVITNPEADGLNVNYNEEGVLLDINGSNQNTSRIGLPPFIQSLFNSEIDIIQNGISTTELKLCTNDTYTLQAIDITGADYVWSLDGVPLAETSSQLLIDTPGFYEVYIEPNNGECPIEGNAVVGVFDIPVAYPLADVKACFDTNTEFYSFNFTNKNSEALLTQDPLLYNVRYFETEEDANANTDEITFPYFNTSNPQTIFVRVDNNENSNCYAINSFNLEIFTTPQIAELNTIEICDNYGDFMDGISVIDLNPLVPTIRGEQDENETTITFHESQNDAENKFNPLSLTYTNTTAFNDTIYIRIENTLNTNCFSTESFNIIINPIPVANTISILQCDEDGIPEGFTTFNINDRFSDITDNTSNTIEFYLSSTDAENQENEIDGNAFNNFFNPQIIYTRVTNSATGCINFSEISLEVSTTSSNNTSLEICDTNGIEDGFMQFNLSNADANILAGLSTGLDLNYYETYEDALLETNPLGTTFTNTTAYHQIIYGRVENANACYGISEIELIVLELPQVETEFETQYCINLFPETMTIDGGIINDSPNNYYYLWSTGEDTSTIQIDTPGTYTVRVTNTNGCFKDRTVTVLPSNIATITNIEVVDATQNNSISILVSGEGDYEYALDDKNGLYQDSNTFNNVQPGLYTIFVRDKNNCGVTESLVSVIGFAKFFTPNNDNANDYWQVKGITEQFQPNSTIYIFDRYGKLIKELNPLSPGWDGTFNGEKMPTSDYWFKVTLEDGRTYTNHFTLKR
ncbi:MULTISPECIES: T9SS type B sorting domain-containing protein [Winogradskyella]|uniref:T9SS type B sorting domain-containing protein n=1 Tax=Winogradskyella TaxID=286104 RepID=UPI0015C6F0E5|nr:MULTISPECIES: T9SS type B sorting domain-containing protein [Winogradskyella]QXP78051.1 T9SS type B sorting domain-containing protein [Winogradskyella sp. HaHa_3_26]